MTASKDSKEPVRHYPRLTFLAHDHRDLPKNTELHAGRRGLAEGSISLDGWDLSFSLNGNPKPRRFSLKWARIGSGAAPLRPELKNGKEGEAWTYMDWGLPCHVIGLTEVDPDKAASCITLPPGRLEARYVARNEGKDQGAIVWIAEPKGKPVHRQAIAETLVYSVKGLDTPLTVHRSSRDKKNGSRETFRLYPRPGRTLRLAVTNLPDRSSGSGLTHMEHYATIGKVPSGEIVTPIPDDGFVTSDGICAYLVAYE